MGVPINLVGQFVAAQEKVGTFMKAPFFFKGQVK